jgi:hypothetical protein
MGVVAQLGATVTFGFPHSKRFGNLVWGVRSASAIIYIILAVTTCIPSILPTNSIHPGHYAHGY